MTRIKSYDRPERKPKIVGRPPALTEWQANYALKYWRLGQRLTVKALARRFNVSPHTLNNYIKGHVKRYKVKQ